jgi:transglutaminase-like putative cysteine protease
MQKITRIYGACVIAAAFASSATHASDLAARSFELTYACTIEEIPEDAQVIDLWIPAAQDTDGQSVTRAEAVWPKGGTFQTESEYGNLIYHKRFEAPFDEKIGAELIFDIHRQEIVVKEAKGLTNASPTKMPDKMAAYLSANRLIPTDGRIDTIAKQLDLEGKSPIHTARAIYDYLIDEFKYNYKAEGAGKGDVLWACDSKTGDCTDYHSMFIALCRNQGIPTTHEFGFPIRTKNPSGDIPYYHCWARFHVDGIGWIPIDASEADKHPELLEYNFGSQSQDLTKFINGRDITLAPPQQGPPLNYFAHAYVEIDGKRHDAITPAVSFKDLPGQDSD